MKFFSIMLTALLSQLFVNAQTQEDSVKQTITAVFAAMKSAQGYALRNYFTDSMILQTIIPDAGKGVKVQNEDISEFLTFIDRTAPGEIDERISFETVKVDGPLAIAWMPYSLYYHGKLSHCGVNLFQLVRENTGWKVNYIIDTRTKTGCK